MQWEQKADIFGDFLPFMVVSFPLAPTHLSLIIGLSMMPRIGLPLCKRLIKVPNKGCPTTSRNWVKLCLPHNKGEIFFQVYRLAICPFQNHMPLYQLQEAFYFL